MQRGSRARGIEVAELSWAGCSFPSDRLYDLDFDTWVSFVSQRTVVVGMTDFSQSRCGRLVHIGWKPVGRVVERGRPLAALESAKWVGPMRAPLTGEIVGSNESAFTTDIALANRDPYGLGWFYRLQVASEAEGGELVDAQSAFTFYRARIDESGLHCFRCVDP